MRVVLNTVILVSALVAPAGNPAAIYSAWDAAARSHGRGARAAAPVKRFDWVWMFTCARTKCFLQANGLTIQIHGTTLLSTLLVNHYGEERSRGSSHDLRCRAVWVGQGSLRIVNRRLTFLDRGALAVRLELGFARASAGPGVEHQKRYEPTG